MGRTIQPNLTDKKICSVCKIDKPKTEYHKLTTKACGVQSKCKECIAKYKKERYWNNRDVELAKLTKSRLKPENVEQRKGYYEKNKDEYKERHLKYMSDKGKADLRREKSKIYYHKNKEKINKRAKAYTKTEAFKKKSSERHKNRKEKDPIYNITRRLRFRLRHLVKSDKETGRQVSSLKLVGCSLFELKDHIESQFVDGMCWGRLSEIDIDHIRPCSSFDLSDFDQQKECFNYTNLRPLWKPDNILKGAIYNNIDYRYERRHGSLKTKIG